ncbi:hypothetical protein FHG87_019422 [Trinorchestia longiramus]|nr:hypothetical protein FHG87_019422 [Trinorchestia longiramus]
MTDRGDESGAPLRQNRGSESSDEARFPLRPEARRRPVRCPVQAAVPSQPLYITRQQRPVSLTLYQALPKSTSLQELSSPEESTQPTAEQKNRNQPSCRRTGWAQTTYALTRIARATTRHELQFGTSRQDVNTSVLDVMTCATKKEIISNRIFKCLNTNN